jgi:hypothetical protein
VKTSGFAVDAEVVIFLPPCSTNYSYERLILLIPISGFPIVAEAQHTNLLLLNCEDN